MNYVVLLARLVLAAILPPSGVLKLRTRDRTLRAVNAFGLPGLQSCTPGGIVRLLDAYQVELTGRHAVVIGRSPILGKPVGVLVLARHATRHLLPLAHRRA